MSNEPQTFETIQQLKEALPNLPDGAVIHDRDGDEVPRSQVYMMSGAFTPYTVTHKPTPSPLDPSKVKAGDTVTVSLTDYELGTYEVKGTVMGHLGGILQVGSAVIATNGTWRDIVTLTAHQPAPEPEPSYGPGIQADVTIREIGSVVKDRRGFFTHTGFVYSTPGGGSREVSRDLLRDVRPLVVIDPTTARKAVVDALATVLPTAVDYELLNAATDAVVATLNVRGVPDAPRPLPTRELLAESMHDDRLPRGEPRLTHLQRLILADAVLVALKAGGAR